MLVPAVLLASAACSGPGQAVAVPATPDGQVSAELDATLTEFLNTVTADARGTGAVAGVWAPWAGSWEKAVGTVSGEGTDALTPDAHLRLGTGGTQSMTCQVVAALAEEGTLALDADASAYLPSLPGLGGVTLRQLCQHTSGLADFADTLWPIYLANPRREWPSLELVSAAQIKAPLSAPGAGWAASNTGPLIAGLAATAVTSRSIDDLYDEYISKRYGLTDTGLPSDGTVDLPAPHPSGYAFALAGPGAAPSCDRLVDVTAVSPSGLGTAGGVITTLSDLRRLAAGSAAIPPSDQVWGAPVTMDPNEPFKTYDLGGSSYGPLRGFSGVAPGFLTAAFSDPASGLTVAISVNNSAAGAGFVQSVAHALAAIVTEAGTADGASGLPALPTTADAARGAVDAQRVCA